MIRTLSIAIAAWLALTLPVLALTPTPVAEQTGPVALVGATIHVGDGTVYPKGIVTFADGKITGVYQDAGEVDIANHEVIDLLGQHIYPGFISIDSDLGLREVDAVRHTRDENERGDLNPNVRSLIAYNTDSEMIPTLRFNGILTAQVAPKGGLVAGTSSVVQLDAWNWEDAALQIDDAVHITWPARKKRQFDFSTFTVKTVDNPDHGKQLHQLQALFRDAAAYAKANIGARSNLKLAAVSDVFDGNKAVFVASNHPGEIVEAVRFLRALEVRRIVLKSADAAAEVADFLSAEEIPVVVTGVHRLPAQPHRAIDEPFRLPAELVNKGLKVALAYPSLMNSRNLGFIAGTAAAYGLEQEQALGLITKNAAEILGVEDRLGSLAVGKNATLFVSQGDALDMRGQQISLAFIDGREVDLNGMQQQLFTRFREKYQR